MCMDAPLLLLSHGYVKLPLCFISQALHILGLGVNPQAVGVHGWGFLLLLLRCPQDMQGRAILMCSCMPMEGAAMRHERAPEQLHS